MMRCSASKTILVWLLILAPCLRAAHGPAEQPNIILILTDDQGYGDLGRHGHPLLETPNLNRLFDESVRLENFYVSPSCAPTRAAIMTGFHEFRSGVTHTIEPRMQLHERVRTLPQLLKSAGYATGFVGKWHLGGAMGYRPCDRGFDWCSTNVGGARQHFDPDIVRDGTRRPSKGFRTDGLFDEAMAFLGANADRPSFCYLATYSPHAPLAAPEEFIAPYRDAVDDKQATFLGMVANIDFNVGRLLDYLHASGLEENTVVVFMTDNGQTEGLDVYNAGMRGGKCSIWEGGSRAISFWRWPGRWQPRTAEQLTAHLDVLPTFCELAGVSIPDSLRSKLEGFSLLPLLQLEGAAGWHDDRMLFQHVGRWPSGLAASHKYAGCAVRQDRYLLVRSGPCNDPACKQFRSQCRRLRAIRRGREAAVYTRENAQFHWAVSPPNRWALFDVRADRACERDLALERPELVSRLSAAYEQWWDSTFPMMIQSGGDRGDPASDRPAARRRTTGPS